MQKMTKKGFALNNPKAIVTGVVVAIVAVSLISATIGTLINATIAIGDTANMPLSGLFAAGGAVVLILGAAVVFAFVKMFLGGKK